MLKITAVPHLDGLLDSLDDRIPAAVRKLENAVLASCEPFVPYHTGRLCASGHPSGTGSSGEITWDAEYAAECYTASRSFNHKIHPKACAAWFEAAKAADLPLWIETAEQALRSKGADPGETRNSERNGK